MRSCNLLSVPKQARQNAGTFLAKGCAIYTYALALFENMLSMPSKERARKESISGNPLVFKGKTKPIQWLVLVSYSTRDTIRVASSPMVTTEAVLCFAM